MNNDYSVYFTESVHFQITTRNMASFVLFKLHGDIDPCSWFIRSIRFEYGKKSKESVWVMKKLHMEILKESL